MLFELETRHAKARNKFRAFAEKHVLPLAAFIDAEERFPRETVDRLAALGWLGLPISAELGGQDSDYLTYCLLIEELSRTCAATGVIVSSHTSLACEAIRAYGNPQQRAQFLTPLAQGEKLGAFALTEHGAGSDVSSLRTIAQRQGDEYRLDGKKIFITNAGEAGVYIVFAATDRNLKTRGISSFVVEAGTPGFTVGSRQAKMGIRACANAELVFSDCRIPAANRLGEEGDGFAIAMKTLDCGRVGIAAQALGVALGAFDATVAYTQTREQFGTRISAFQNTRFAIADMRTRIEAARLLVYRAAARKDAGKAFRAEAAMAKLYASETAMAITNQCVQLHGGYGYLRDLPLERMMRDAKITEIYEGTNEIQRMVVAANTFS